MKHHVIDASMVAAAFFQEEHADAARSLLASGQDLHAPDLVIAEMANMIWKRRRRDEIEEDEARDLLTSLLQLPLQLTSSATVAEEALELAMRTNQSTYDCLYLALAVNLKCAMVTADKRLVNTLIGSPLEKHVAWIGEQ